MVPKTPKGSRNSSHPRHRPGVVVLIEKDNDNMSSNWTDRLTVRKTTRGYFSVSGDKFVESNNPPYRHKWENWDNVLNIKSPQALINEVKGVAEMLGVEVEWVDAIEEIAKLDWLTARVIAGIQDIPLVGVPPLEELQSQRPLSRIGNVSITVEWGYELHTLKVPFERWIGILHGEPFHDTQPYTYEAKRYCSEWTFDTNAENQLYVGYDDCGVGWIGNLEDIQSIEGPVIDGVHLGRAALESAKDL